jgi:hypothetical protein
LREAVELFRHAVDVLDTARAPRRRLEGAFHELIPLQFDEFANGPLRDKLHALRAVIRRAPAEDEDAAIAASVAALSDAEVQEQMDVIRALYGDVRHEWDVARGKS